MKDRFILQETETGYCCTDQKNMIVCRFIARRFNDTQKITMLDDNVLSAIKIATALREMADWLIENHKDKVY